MSNADARDAYVEVVVDLPNGKAVRGKPVRFADAMTCLVLSDGYAAGAAPGESLAPMLQKFFTLTGMSPDDPALEGLTLGELLDMMQRFFFHRRPARIAALPTSAPSPAAPTPS